MPAPQWSVPSAMPALQFSLHLGIRGSEFSDRDCRIVTRTSIKSVARGKSEAGELAEQHVVAVVPVQENLRCTSSFDVPSSRMDDAISMDVEGRRSSNNYNTESRSAWNRLAQCIHLKTNWGCRMAPAGSGRNNPDVNRKKGLLGAFYTIAEKLFIFCGSLVIWSVQYPHSSNARWTSDDHGMQGIIIASFVSFFISCILATLAAYLKDSESFQGTGIKIFKWLFLIVLLGLCAELSVILRFSADIRKSVLWSLGIVGSIAIVLLWAWVFYVEVPQEETRYRTENQMLLEMQAPAEPASSTPSVPPV